MNDLIKGITTLLTLILTTTWTTAKAAEEAWQEYLQDYYENSEEAAVAMEEAYDYLNEMTLQPLDINKADAEELTTIPGMDLNIINDIMDYREKYGHLRSISELALIPSVGNGMLRYLENFITVAEDAATPWYSRDELTERMKRMSHTVTATADIPAYSRRGNYLGDATSHSIRYTARLGRHAALNVNGGKSAGEPFFSRGNGMGYDTYAYNLWAKDWGRVKQIVAGKFRGQFGMGLTLNNTFTPDRQAMAAAAGHRATVFEPHSSTGDARHLQGVAATVDVGGVKVAAFVSYRHIDATMNDDATIATILTSGYHRTRGEMARKNNATQFATGAHADLNGRIGTKTRWGIGASAIYTSLNHSLNPTYSVSGTVTSGRLYRLYYPHGSGFSNFAVDYALHHRHMDLRGETAINDRAAIATINSLNLRLTRRLSMAAIQRYYSYRYYALYGAAFGGGTQVQNESGLYVAMQWQAMRSLTVNAYTDVSYSPWLKYRVSGSSYAWDNSVNASYTAGDWTLAVRYRLRSRQRDATDSGTKAKRLTVKNDHYLRLTAAYADSRWTLRSQIEGTVQSISGTSKGMIGSQQVSCTINDTWKIYGIAAYFNTDDYDSRLYVYERGMLNAFNFSAYYGHGIRYALMLRTEITGGLTAIVKGGHTHYFDRSMIGTGERQIMSNHQTDIDLQLRVRF